MRCAHEPQGIPLTRPSDTLSPTGLSFPTFFCAGRRWFGAGGGHQRGVAAIKPRVGSPTRSLEQAALRSIRGQTRSQDNPESGQLRGRRKTESNQAVRCRSGLDDLPDLCLP
jgi:hypothetical protein